MNHLLCRWLSYLSIRAVLEACELLSLSDSTSVASKIIFRGLSNNHFRVISNNTDFSLKGILEKIRKNAATCHAYKQRVVDLPCTGVDISNCPPPRGRRKWKFELWGKNEKRERGKKEKREFLTLFCKIGKIYGNFTLLREIWNFVQGGGRKWFAM